MIMKEVKKEQKEIKKMDKTTTKKYDKVLNKPNTEVLVYENTMHKDERKNFKYTCKQKRIIIP